MGLRQGGVAWLTGGTRPLFTQNPAPPQATSSVSHPTNPLMTNQRERESADRRREKGVKTTRVKKKKKTKNAPAALCGLWKKVGSNRISLKKKDHYRKLHVRYWLFSILLQLTNIHNALHLKTKKAFIYLFFCMCVFLHSTCECVAVFLSCVCMCVYVLFRLILHCEWWGRATGDHVTRVRLNPAPTRFSGVTQGSSCGYCARCQIYKHTHTHTKHKYAQRHKSTQAHTVHEEINRHTWTQKHTLRTQNVMIEQHMANFHMTTSP